MIWISWHRALYFKGFHDLTLNNGWWFSAIRVTEISRESLRGLLCNFKQKSFLSEGLSGGKYSYSTNGGYTDYFGLGPTLTY